MTHAGSRQRLISVFWLNYRLDLFLAYPIVSPLSGHSRLYSHHQGRILPEKPLEEKVMICYD